MAKQNIHSNIKFDKDSYELPYTKITKGAYAGNTVTFTLDINNLKSKYSVCLILVDNNGTEGLLLPIIHDGNLYCFNTVYGNVKGTVSNNRVLTLTMSNYSYATLIDFENNSWS